RGSGAPLQTAPPRRRCRAAGPRSCRRSRADTARRRAKQASRRDYRMRAGNRYWPAPTQDLEDYLDRFPEDVFVALEGFVEHANTGGADNPLAIGHLLLVQRQLERIRYRKDRGYEDAIRLIETFQHSVANLAVAGRIDGQELSMVASA